MLRTAIFWKSVGYNECPSCSIISRKHARTHGRYERVTSHYAHNYTAPTCACVFSVLSVGNSSHAGIVSHFQSNTLHIYEYCNATHYYACSHTYRRHAMVRTLPAIALRHKLALLGHNCLNWLLGLLDYCSLCLTCNSLNSSLLVCLVGGME